jgi:hypothetical protein
MKHFEIESWTRRICERVQNKRPIEDSRVELKADWTDAPKAARRIAGHANAARGEAILWLIGVDEIKGVTGANCQEFSNWWSKAKATFESEFPSLQDLNIDVDGKTVVALCFDTSRFPFVVRTPAWGKVAGEVEYEVPWRDGTAIRTAKRGDLFLMLSPLLRTPKIELLEGEVFFDTGGCHPKGIPNFSFNITTYVVPVSEGALCFPVHKCKAEITCGTVVIGDGFAIHIDSPIATLERLKDAAVLRAPNMSVTIPVNELILNRPQMVSLEGALGPATRYSGQDDFELSLKLVEAVSDSVSVIRGGFKRSPKDGNHNRWEFVK